MVRDTCHDVQGVWMGRTLADVRIDAAEDLHRPESRYTNLISFGAYVIAFKFQISL